MHIHTRGDALQVLASLLDVPSIEFVEHIQTLWSGYGRLFKIRHGSKSFIVKWISPPEHQKHPRGFGGSYSHERKLRSYRIERTFYEHWAHRTTPQCRLPQLKTAAEVDASLVLILEDLDMAGFPSRCNEVSDVGMRAALDWLAAFHAQFLGVIPDNLWPVGTYWHLATRPDELAATRDPRLKQVASLLDERLSGATYQTLVHGDAKVANFCFSSDHSQVAAVDFQYVGGGCGIKDVAYLLSSCLTENQLMQQEHCLLAYYFERLRSYLESHAIDSELVVQEWLSLYPVAWADFARFLSGWAPEHWKLHRYTEHQIQSALAQLANG